MKLVKAFTALSLFVGSAAFAGKLATQDIKCLSDIDGRQTKNIPVFESDVRQIKGQSFMGHTLAVTFYPGDEYEGQQLLSMSMDGYTTHVYDPKVSLYVVEAQDGVRLQCYIVQ